MLESNPMLQAQIIMVPLAIVLLMAVSIANSGFNKAAHLQNPGRSCAATFVLVIGVIFGIVVFVAFLSGVIMYGPGGTSGW